jgi:hypothetical protein
MKKLQLITTLIYFTFQFSSCNKKEVVPANKKELISAHTWITSDASFTPNGLFPLNVYKKDATNNAIDASKISLNFKSDGTILATDQNGKSISGNWALNADETAITIPNGVLGNITEVKVAELTTANLKLNVLNFSAAVLGQNYTGLLAVNMIPK